MHKTTGLVAALVALVGLQSARAETDLDFVINAQPASILLDTSGDKFSVTGADGSKTSLSEVYTMPNIALGVGMPVGDRCYVDLLGGGGVIINDGFRSFMLQILLEGCISVSESLDIGPRVGLVYFPDPEWLENDDIEFDSDTGFLVGVGIAMGDKIKYLVSVDLIDTSLDVTTNSGTPSDDTFEMTSLAIQFGVRGEF